MSGFDFCPKADEKNEEDGVRCARCALLKNNAETDEGQACMGVHSIANRARKEYRHS